MRLPFSSKEQCLQCNLLESNCRRYGWNTALWFLFWSRGSIFLLKNSGPRLPELVLSTDGIATQKYWERGRGAVLLYIPVVELSSLRGKKKLIKIHKGTAASLNNCYKELEMVLTCNWISNISIFICLPFKGLEVANAQSSARSPCFLKGQETQVLSKTIMDKNKKNHTFQVPISKCYVLI